MGTFKLNKEKAINTLLYVVKKLEKADKHKMYKILYFADQKHLVNYGRPIIGDTYFKLEYGPVPSFVKNIVDEQIKGLEEIVAVYNKYYIKAIQEIDLDFLSESDIECLDDAINENKDLSFADLTAKSHDYAYEKAIWTIDYMDIARTLTKDENVLNYINNQLINDRINLHESC
ncbi:MAG: SocA family protein [Labilibaculum sp.]|nr:SocA family protein [Labilibaculum sp.]